ncbi:unnamed protein product, partial [Polarella glacialis]
DATAARSCGCSESCPSPLVTSFVCNDDMVPRVSLQNLGRMSLLAKGAAVEDVFQLGGASESLAKGQTWPSEADFAGTRTEGSSSAVPDLLVPGRVIVLHKMATPPSQSAEKQGEAEKPPDAEVLGQKSEPSQVTEAAGQQPTSNSDSEESEEEEEEVPDKSEPPGVWSAWLGDGTLPELSYVELAPSSVSDHMAPVYRE